MNLDLKICINGIIYSFSFLNKCESKRIEIKDELIIDIYKIHNHKYCFKAFFYNSKRIYSMFYCNSKLKLYSAVQNLLKEELYDV